MPIVRQTLVISNETEIAVRQPKLHTGNAIVLEDGTYILLETGTDVLLKESG